MTPEERADVRDEHYEVSPQMCRSCGFKWPCPTVDLLDELERVEAERAKERAEAWSAVFERDALRAAAEAVVATYYGLGTTADLPSKQMAKLRALLASVGLPEGKPQP